MTSIPQFHDINADPFIINGKAIIESLKLQVGTSCVPRPNDAPGFIAFDSHYLYFDDKHFNDLYFDFLIKAFADKKECHPPVRIVLGGKPLVSTFYKLNFRRVPERIKPHFWGKEDTLKVKAEIKGFLSEYLVQYFYDYLSF